MNTEEVKERYQWMLSTTNRCIALLEKRRNVLEKTIQSDPTPTACELATQELLIALIAKELACATP